MIFSGGLLYNILFNDKFDNKKFCDMDLFLYGDE